MWCLIWCFSKSWKPPDGDHDKVILKCSRDRSRDKASQQSNSETWWRRTTATLLGVSFGSYRRRRRDVLLRCHCMFHLRLIWDVVKTYWWGVVIASPWDVVTTNQWKHTSWRRTSETSWRSSTETSLGVSIERYLRRRWDVQKDVVTTLPGSLAAEWEISVLK